MEMMLDMIWNNRYIYMVALLLEFQFLGTVLLLSLRSAYCSLTELHLWFPGVTIYPDEYLLLGSAGLCLTLQPVILLVLFSFDL